MFEFSRSFLTVESSFVAKLISSLPPDIRLEVPAGDDAAVVRPPAMRRTVITVDMLMEGTDFLPFPATDPKAVGYKALAVNLSDLAAMGARPEVAVVAVALPIKHGRTIGDEMLEGMLPLAKQFNIAIAGGDTNSWDNLLVVSVTAIGSVEPGKAWRRDGAVPGDVILVTGAFGGSILGRHLCFLPRCNEALAMTARWEIHAAIDSSDGLSLDLFRMMSASNTGARLECDRIPIHEDARNYAQQGSGQTPLEHAFGDGEDFELILALDPQVASDLINEFKHLFPETPLSVIGTVTATPGIVCVLPNGDMRQLEPRGYQHLFTSNCSLKTSCD